MNILFFLTPKNDVALLYSDQTLRQALEIMEYHRYTAIPMIDRNGKYIGTVTEGDLLWTIKKGNHLSLKESEGIPILSIERRKDNKPVSINTTMEDLMDKAINQNFVPVVDNVEHFIGIVTRKDIMQYFYRQLKKEES